MDIEARRRAREKYKKSAKGKLANERWIKSKRRAENEKRYRAKPRSKELAVIRATKHLNNCISCQIKKRVRDKAYSKSEAGRLNNNMSVRKYRQTDKGRWQGKVYKYYLRNNTSGKIDKVAWELKLKQLDGKCQLCGTIENITIDHIISLSKGGTNLIANLQPLCRSCNCSKSNKI